MGLGGRWSRVPGCGRGDTLGGWHGPVSQEAPEPHREDSWPGPRSGRASLASLPPCTPQVEGEAAVGQFAGPAQGATLSPRLFLGRWEGGKEQGGANWGCEGGGGEVERPAGHLTVLAWRGAASGRAWRAGHGGQRGHGVGGNGAWWCPGSVGRAWGCTWPLRGLEGCGDSPASLATLTGFRCQPGPTPRVLLQASRQV